VDGLLEQVFAVLPAERAFADVLTPALVEVGEAWRAGRLNVAEEHSFSSKIRGRLEQLLADERPAIRGTAVLACAPREQHELGLMMLAIGLRADGWRVEYLGAATPPRDALDFAERVGARLVCFSASRDQAASALATALRKVDTSEPPAIAIGGTAADPRLCRALGVEHAPKDVGAAVRHLRAWSAP
jgi:methanogenic corrinoid protein MtbC1